MTYRGHIENGMVVIDEPVQLPDGAGVTILVDPSVEVQAAGGPRQEPTGRPTPEMLQRLASLFAREDIEEFKEALKDCRKVDADGW